MNPWLIIALLVAWLGSLGWAHQRGYTAGADHCAAVDANDKRTAEVAGAAAASAAAAAISSIEVKNVRITQRVETEIREKPVYRDCRNTPSVLDDINEARTGRRPEPVAAGVLPAASAADR